MREMFSKIKETATSVAEKVVAEPEKPWVDDAKSPYVGFTMDKEGNVTGRAPAGPHNLLLAGTGAGKARRVLVPQIMTWEGPIVAVSSKGDLAGYTAAHRARSGGPIYLMDLSGQVDPSKIDADMIPVVNDPCRLLAADANGFTDDSAKEMAVMLTSLKDTDGGGGGDAEFWASLCHGVLACLLQAGAGYIDPETDEWVDGGGVSWVLRALLNPGDSEDPDAIDFDTPSWETAALRAATVDSEHIYEVEATKALEQRQRDSIGINLRVALNHWRQRKVRGTAEAVCFTPDLMENENATLFVVSPWGGAAKSIASLTIHSMIKHWEINEARNLPAISMVIDECPNICPLPDLDKAVATMRSYKMHFSVAGQNHEQFIKMTGNKDKAMALIKSFPSVLLGMGVVEQELLEIAAWAMPPSERRVESKDSSGRNNTSVDKVETFHGSELLPAHQGEGRLLVGGRSGMKVKLVDFKYM